MLLFARRYDESVDGAFSHDAELVTWSDLTDGRNETPPAKAGRLDGHRPLTSRPSLNQTPSQSSLLSLHLSSTASLTTASTSDKPQMK